MESSELYTWVRYAREDEKLKNIDWNRLSKYVELLDRFQRKFPVQDQIEEQPPAVYGNTFNPGGWVGTYRIGERFLRVVPDPKRLSLKEFASIREELVGWLEYIGPFLENLYQRYVDERLFRELLFATYSRHLVDYTEILLAHFVPREVVGKEYVGSELRGKPIWKKIILQRAKNSTLLVSRKVEFSFRTLPNLLLTRFHAELLGDITSFLSQVREDDFCDFFQDWKMYAAYHQEFINTGIWSNLLEESLNLDFSSGEVLEKTRRTTKGEVIEILDLWEAYLANKSFLSDFGRRFDTALKPLSKIYELWCFKKLCDLLGINANRIQRFPCRLPFKLLGSKHRLYYNTKRGLKKHSGFMSKVPVPIGRPDFVIESGGKVVCIMDAKCKTINDLETDDFHRLLSYILDFMYPTREKLKALVFYISRSKEIRSLTAKNCEIYLVPMTPTSYSHVKDKIKSLIQSTLIAS